MNKESLEGALVDAHEALSESQKHDYRERRRRVRSAFRKLKGLRSPKIARYASPAALEHPGSHNLVIADIFDELEYSFYFGEFENNSDRLSAVLGCVVTKAEHDRLSIFRAPSHGVRGWSVFAAAGVAVIDQWTNLTILEKCTFCRKAMAPEKLQAHKATHRPSSSKLHARELPKRGKSTSGGLPTLGKRR